jgi:cell division transport system permease protein
MRSLGYYLRRALQGIRSNLLVTFLSVVTIAVSLLTLGTFLLLYLNLRASTAGWGGDAQIVAYLAEGPSMEEVNHLSESISRLAGVSAVKYVSREDALQRFRRDLGAQAGVLDGLTTNPLPASLEIQLRDRAADTERVRALADRVRTMTGVDDVQYGQEWISQYRAFVNLLRVLGVVIGLFLLGGAVLVVANTIKLAVYARRDELEILSLVGASKPFVRIPLLIEGLVQGVLGAALAVAILYGAYTFLLPRIHDSLLLSAGGFKMVFLSGEWMLALLAVGAAVGLCGSALSVGRFGRT